MTINKKFTKQEIRDIVAKLTLEEKAAFCDGEDFWHTKAVARLGIPSIMMCDGPHGLRKQNPDRKKIGISNSVPAVCFPTAVTTACSWDRTLLYEMGQALGDECKKERVSILLGPGVNIKRSPLCGRNFEYFSEDPLLAGEMAAAFINGVQSRGVGTSLKHYAANNQETRRMTVSAVVDERALREIYLPAFETAVKKAQPKTVMCAYNRLNGEYCAENDRLLNQILRDEWGFEGLVVSDWGAVNDRAKGVAAGNDLEMPSSKGVNSAKILQAVSEGRLSEEALDKCVGLILAAVLEAAAQIDGEYAFDPDCQHRLAGKVAAGSLVLMKNKDGVLPLKKGAKVAVIGEMARFPRYQGAGSSLINPTRMENALDSLRALGVNTVYSPGYSRKSPVPNAELIAKAVEAARSCDTVLVFAGLTEDYESEGFDRSHMNLPAAHNKLIEAVSSANRNTVVVLAGGSPVAMPWLGNVKGLLNTYLAGQAGAKAAAEILTGAVNPSGKLAETYPCCEKCTPGANFFPGNPMTVEYRESIYVGYRYYEKAKRPVAFPFGFGLSYTSFEYSGLRLSRKKISGENGLTVSLRVKNTGARAGSEIVQLYVADKESTVFRPEKELKGFEKVDLEPGEEKTVTFKLDKRAFAFYNTLTGGWCVENGLFDILAGASSADIRLSAEVEVAAPGTAEPMPDLREKAPGYYTGDVLDIEPEQFEALLGYPLPPAYREAGLPVDLTDNFENAQETKWGGRLCDFITFVMRMADKGPNAGMMAAVALQTPFRNFVTMSGGLFTEKMAGGLLMILNGDKPCKGLGKIVSGVPHMVKNLNKFLKTI